MTNDFLVIIRSVSERTEAVCKRLIIDQGVNDNQVVIINEIPFTRAIERTLQIGIQFNKKWTLVIDADVLCCSNSIERILTKIESLSEDTFEIQGYILDKYFGGVRTGGIHLYRTSYFEIALNRLFPLPENVLRPESYLIEKMNELGYTWMRVPIIIGVHDFEQAYEDIYRKSFIQGRKSLGYTELLMETWKVGIQNGDIDYEVAMYGFLDGLQSIQFVSIDKGSEIVKKYFEKLGVVEKHPISINSINLVHIDNLIAHWKPSPTYIQFLTKLKTEFLFPEKFKKLTFKDKIREKWNSLTIFNFLVFMIGFLINKLGQRIESLAK